MQVSAPCSRPPRTVTQSAGGPCRGGGAGGSGAVRVPEVSPWAWGCGGSGGSAPERSEPRAWGCENRGWGAGGSFPKPPHGMGVLGGVIFTHTLHSGGIFLLRGRAVSRFLVGTERVCRGGTGRAGLHPGASASDGGPPGAALSPLLEPGSPRSVCLPDGPAAGEQHSRCRHLCLQPCLAPLRSSARCWWQPGWVPPRGFPLPPTPL